MIEYRAKRLALIYECWTYNLFYQTMSNVQQLFRSLAECLHSGRLMLHIHLAICISVHWSLQVSSLLTVHVSLPYSIAILTQAIQVLPSILCENTLGVESANSFLNFFQLVLTQVTELASSPLPERGWYHDAHYETTPPFLAKSPLKSANCPTPLFMQSPPSILVFREHPPL